MDSSSDQLDITPMGVGTNIMDPYELFSTPPSEMMLSSTPSKPAQPKNSKATKVLRARNINRNRSSSFRIDTTIRAANNSNKANSSAIITSASNNTRTTRSTTTSNNNNKNNNNRINKRASKKQKPTDNLWDKCLKSNPELAQFVDNFNQSLEEALSKPLDITGD